MVHCNSCVPSPARSDVPVSSQGPPGAVAPGVLRWSRDIRTPIV